MKKALTLLLLIFMLVLIGCKKEDEGSKKLEPTGTYTTGVTNSRNYIYYVPENYDEGVATPLFVMLHGASQTAYSFAEVTQMSLLADQKGFIVLYPEQSSTFNIGLSWNWFYPSNQIRAGSEPTAIANMITAVKNELNIDDEKVFVAGLSSGGAMAVIMAIVYPDLIKGVAIAAGLEYKAATTVAGAIAAVSDGGPDPDTQAQLAYLNMPAEYLHTIPTLVFHGTSDTTVDLINGNQVLSQFAVLNDLLDDGEQNGSILDSPSSLSVLQVPGGYTYTKYQYLDSSGSVLMEKYIINNMRHAWPGGKAGVIYSDSWGPDMSTIMYEFFI